MLAEKKGFMYFDRAVMDLNNPIGPVSLCILGQGILFVVAFFKVLYDYGNVTWLRNDSDVYFWGQNWLYIYQWVRLYMW